MQKTPTLHDAYQFPGFTPTGDVYTDPETPDVFVLPLQRRQKKRFAACATHPIVALMTTSRVGLAISIVVVAPCFWSLNIVACTVRSAG